MKSKAYRFSQENNNKAVEHPMDVGVHQRIEKRAHNLWLADGCRQGDDLRYWLQAEGEVLEKMGRKKESEYS